MTVSNFIDKFNWRLILVHVLATFFFVLAARQFVVLNDSGIVNLVDEHGYPNAFEHLTKEDNFSPRLSYFVLWTNLSVLIGLLIAFLISIGLTIKKKAFWLNSFIVLVTAILLTRLGLFENKIIDTIFFSPGELTTQFGLQYKFITNGIILTFIGLLIFFSKKTNYFAFNQTVSGNFPK